MQITQCPECATAFKVTPEQLKLADGWVRCGRCGAVFEALKQSLTAPEASPPLPSATATSDPIPVSSPPSPPSPPRRTASVKTPPLNVGRDPLPSPPSSPVEEFSSLLESSFGPTFDPTWSPATSPALNPSQGTDAGVSRAHAGWTHAGWKWLSALLVLGVLWQVVLHKRDWLLAQEPGLRGVLTVLCAPVGCEPHWPKLPESLQVDSSSFVHDPQGFYSVQLRVKNTEHFALAAPHVELTLVDTYDDIVLRRVFTPQELSLADAIPPLRDARAGLDFVLDAAVMERVTGYRVLLFYP
jgi:predicted Zn finger-like uncharacterized protein